MSQDLHKRYGLRRVINACGKMTALAGAKVLPEIIEPVRQALGEFFELDELQAAAGRIIAEASGAESGCVTACTSAGITTCVAACMTGDSLAKVWQLPNPEGMPHRVLIQKGHCVNYGAPLTQAVRLAGATPVEMGVVNRCTEEEIAYELEKPDVAAILAVESHHTVQYGWVPLPRVVEMAHDAGVPVIVDGAAQDWRLRALVATGADVIITSAHKFLCSTTGGIIVGRSSLVNAAYLQNRGIGRGMKAGKEAIIGAMAALEFRMQQQVADWTSEQDRRVALILEQLAGINGLELSVHPDPNGCPFSRARITLAPDIVGVTAEQLAQQLKNGDPTIVVRAHHVDEGYFYIDAIELTDDEIKLTCNTIRQLLARKNS